MATSGFSVSSVMGYRSDLVSKLSPPDARLTFRASTGHGAGRREAIENRTDELAVYPYEAIGAAGCERLRSLAASLAIRVIEGDLGFPPVLSQRCRQAIRAGAR